MRRGGDQEAEGTCLLLAGLLDTFSLAGPPPLQKRRHCKFDAVPGVSAAAGRC